VAIHSTAIIHPDAQLEEDVQIGPYSVLGKNVKVARGTQIGPHVVIDSNTVIGRRCKIFPFSSLGQPPQDIKYQGEDSWVVIGDNNVIREYVTIHRGTRRGGGKTTLGNDNYLMAYVHIAHDCHIGNQVIMANGATLAGHIEIEDNAIIGGLSAIHQYVRIGAYALIGGASGIPQDVVPYVSAVGNRARLFGINVVGLKRHGFSEQTIRRLKLAYRLIFRSGMKLNDALARLAGKVGECSEVDRLVDFIRKSQRGILR
jgi:UDP-N-acetylglucosamine acyltransferase